MSDHISRGFGRELEARVMTWKRLVLLWAVAAAASLLAGPVTAADEPNILRVCGDPDNLPFSNQKLEGFENKIAEVIAKDLGMTVSYYCWPHQRGLVRNTLNAGMCDVLIGIPKGWDPVLWTKPYFRSAYVFAYLPKSGRALASLDDPSLKQLKVGTYLNSPPFDALAERGITANVVTYPLFFDPRVPDPSRRPVKLLQDLVSEEIDVAIAWGPMAGYFTKTALGNGPAGQRPALTLVPLEDSGPIPMTFEFSMGVRKGNTALKARLEEAIDHRSAEIAKILGDYGVPLLPLKPPRAGGAEEPTRGPEQSAPSRKPQQ
jgi:mxaJ protein